MKRALNLTINVGVADADVAVTVHVTPLTSAREQSKLDLFLSPFASLPFDDECGRRCAEVRAELERAGRVIGPHDLQIASIALHHGLTLGTHNTPEFGRISGLRLDDWEI